MSADAPAPRPALSAAQRARVAAAREARAVLAARTLVTSGAVDVFDVIRLAHYFVTGDPDA